MKKKKYSSIGAILIIGAMLMQLIIPIGVSAQGLPAPTGSGTLEDPYTIMSVDNFLWIAENNTAQSGFSGMYFKQTADIDMSGVANYAPIGGDEDINNLKEFNGSYDGNGYKISNLTYVDNSDISTGLIEVGLFGSVGEVGEIKNLTLDNVNITGNGRNYSKLGILVGKNSGTIKYCKIEANCSLTGQRNNCMGAFAGVNDRIIKKCTNEAAVSGIGGNTLVGGIVGDNYSTIINCLNKGAVSGGGDANGGIAGMDEYGGTYFCLNVGNTGGTGAIIGILADGVPTDNNYLNTATHGVANDVTAGGGSSDNGCSSKTDVELKEQATFTNWDFTNNWSIDEGNAYPVPLSVVSAPELSVTVAPGSAVGTTSITPDEVLSAGHHWAIYKFFTNPIATPDAGDKANSWSWAAYSAGDDISGVDANTKKYVAICDVNPLGNIEKFKLVTLTTQDIKFYGVQPLGSGTENDPYLIGEEGNLLWMGEQSNYNSQDFSGKYFKQTADIDMTGITDFLPIGDSNYEFNGTYDGDKHKITNLTIDKSLDGELGFFGVIGTGTVKNVLLEDLTVNSDDTNNWAFGGIAGCNYNGTISNCHITGNSTISGFCEVGGIVGENDGGSIEQCSNEAVIILKGSGWSTVGGIVGGMYGGNLRECYNTGSVTDNTGQMAGGIVGDLSDTNSHITNCFNTGLVTGTSDKVGGIVGYLESGVLENNLFLDTSASNAYGHNDTGVDYSDQAVAKTSSQMKEQATYIDCGWDLTPDTGVWAIDININSGYPYLQSSVTTPTPEELANIDIAAAKALIPTELTVAEGVYTNLLTYLNGITGMSNTGVTLTLASSNANIANDGTITYSSSQVTGNVVVHIIKANGTEDTKTIAVTVPAHYSSGGSSNYTAPAQNTNTGADILVNGKIQTAGTVSTKKDGDKTVTTIELDQQKLEQKLEKEGSNAVVTIPVNTKADVVVGKLNGQTVKNMETREAVLEVKTEKVTYTLPASQINIDAVSQQMGTQVELKDIAVNVKISEPENDTVKVVEEIANKNSYQVVVKPVEFEITCTSGNKTVEVSKFNAYVERIVAIPEGVDPSKITTGVVLNPDGTFSHVPTTIIVIEGKYYAKINSLTNSTYSVIYSPKTFKDVETHWSKNEVNDMGSRLIINGIGDGNFEPDRDITRAEFSAIVVKGLGLMRPGAGKDSFKDVKKGDWYYDAVSIAYEYKLINGYSDGNFEPESKITREEAMAIISRAVAIVKYDITVSDSDIQEQLTKFTDGSDIGSWARTAVTVCVKSGIVNGSNGKVYAKDDISRAETAAIVRRMLQKAKLI